MKTMLKKLQKRNNKKGFTLVEIIVVLVIMAILAAIAVPAVMGYIDDANDAKYLAEARSAYLVVQTEEAKQKTDSSITLATIADRIETECAFTKDSVTVTKDAAATDTKTYNYVIKWTSDAAHEAGVNTNKEIKIIS